MKEAAEDRETAGIWKTIGGVALIVTGVACIVVTCGAATPAVVIGGTAIGGTTVLFGTADAIEGGQDIYYGTVGDINTKSFNYIRDTVFFGNEKVYGITENVFAFATSAAIPIGAAYGEIGKLSFRTVGTIIGEEIISDQAGNLANMAVNEVGEYFNWNDDVTRVLSMGAGMLASNTTSNGLVSLDKKLNISRNFPDIKTNIPETPFKYKHNPSDNPKVLQDALENPNAVYGYRPRTDGSLAAFVDGEWSNPIAVEGYRQDRIAYHNRNEGAAQQMVSNMFSDGASVEDVAKAVNEYRNQSRINSYIDSQGNIKNIDGYNAALLRAEKNSYENLIKSGKTPEQIIKSATKGNPAMDACTGLYDEYFDTY